MLKYKLVSRNGDAMMYHYMPEGTGKPGIVSIDAQNGETEVLAVSADDIGMRYATKLTTRLEEMFAQKAMREEGVVAWY
jgi:hypothetical protein